MSVIVLPNLVLIWYMTHGAPNLVLFSLTSHLRTRDGGRFIPVYNVVAKIEKEPYFKSWLQHVQNIA